MNHTLRNWLIGTATSIARTAGGAALATVKSLAERTAVLEMRVNDTHQRLEHIEPKRDHRDLGILDSAVRGLDWGNRQVRSVGTSSAFRQAAAPCPGLRDYSRRR